MFLIFLTMTISNMVNSLTDSLNSVRLPAQTLPALLLKCISLKRPGLSAYKISAEIIQNNQKLGIPTGPNPDGSDNLINAFVYNIVKTNVDALHNDASVQSSMAMNTLSIEAIGGNSGGPVICKGTNLTDTINRGIII
jgi:hypothetical protein